MSYAIHVKAVLAGGQQLFLDLPITMSNWTRWVVIFESLPYLNPFHSGLNPARWFVASVTLTISLWDLPSLHHPLYQVKHPTSRNLKDLAAGTLLPISLLDETPHRVWV